MEKSSEIEIKAPLILAEIQKATSILLHCHPSPDPDSVGSALAMKFVLEGMGKKVTVIQGDSKIPLAFMHFPGAKEIISKNFFEINIKDFDLFIILDSGSKEMISRFKPIELPLVIKSIVIDHHFSNKGFADINLVESKYPATCQVLFDLFKSWNIEITENVAQNLFIGLYTDTGGFKYEGVSAKTFMTAAELAKIIKNLPELIFRMENSNMSDLIVFQGLALSNVEEHLNGKLAMAVVSNKMIMEKGIDIQNVGGSDISPTLKTVIGWDIDVALVEVQPGKNKVSFRTRDAEKYDVSKLAAMLGGGGHKAASGAVLNMPIEDAKRIVVEKAKELYNL
ncbi:MAG: bifunctional oligoribonuclease/PAP phosphatase NrnA [Candidatus Paceibacterota bacterium]|jgi:phosphoesterase RecJ-like protein